MKDYSQFGEQSAILAALGYPRNMVFSNGGVFAPLDASDPNNSNLISLEGHGQTLLDIGACHPTDKSNTRALFELGWSGVMIEPSPQPMLNLLEGYGWEERITLIQAAVGCEPGYMELYVTDDMVTTSSKDEYERWKDTAKFRGKMTVPVLTWQEISNRWGGFDFVSIDSEGQSAELFLQMLALGLFPRCVCCEHDGRTTELLSAATFHGYRAVACNGTNLVVAR